MKDDLEKRIDDFHKPSRSRINDILNFIFTWFPLSLCILWLGQSSYTIIITKNWFGSTHLFLFGNIHSLTVISVTILYILLNFTFDVYHTVPLPMRVVSIALFISLGLQFNGIVWSVCNLYFGSGTSIPLLNIGFFAVMLSLLYSINRRYEIVELHYRFLIVSILFFWVSLFLFLYSGFFYNWYLTEVYGAPDPHNWQWGLEQFVGVWLWAGIARTK